MNDNLNNQNGYTLTLVLFALALITILGLSLFTITTNSMKLSSSERNNQATYYIAEAGLVLSIDAIDNFVEKTYLQMKIVYDALKTEEDKNNFEFEKNFYLTIEQELTTESPTTKNILLYKDTNTIQNTFDKQLNNEKPTFSVNIEKSSNGDTRPVTYRLTSTGTIDNHERKVVQDITVTHLFNTNGNNPNDPTAYEKDLWGSDAKINKTDKTIIVNTFNYKSNNNIDLSSYYDNSWNLIINGEFKIHGNGNFIFPGSITANSSHINSHSCVKVGNTFKVATEIKLTNKGTLITDFLSYNGSFKHIKGDYFILSSGDVPNKSCTGNAPPPKNNNDFMETDQYTKTSQPYEVD